jgi:hypothetical protein
MPESFIRTCTDQYLPDDDPFLHPELLGAKAAAETSKMWDPGDTLRISFMDGNDLLWSKVKLAANEWCKHANIIFDFGDHQDAQIRISFTYQLGRSWSKVGKDALVQPTDKPTMNLGWLLPTFYPKTTDVELRHVVLHEFGHVLGLIHEHQNPDIVGKIKWKKQAVYNHYAQQGWPSDRVDVNIFKVYDKNTTQYGKFDEKSIMLYPIDPKLTLDGYSTPVNTELSPTDIAYIKLFYPGKA